MPYARGSKFWHYPLKPVHQPTAADDLVAPPERFEGPRAPAPSAGRLWTGGADIPPQLGEPTVWAASFPPGEKLIDVYAWGKVLEALWRPVQVGTLAALMQYQGNPAWLEWKGGAGGGREPLHRGEPP